MTRLAHHLDASSYPRVLADKLLDGFKYGFPLGHHNDPISNELNHVKISEEKMIILQQKINTEVALGRVAGPFSEPPFSNFQISPVNLREKSTPGAFRLLHNLSYPYNEHSINSNISDDDKSVKYSSIHDAIKSLSNFLPGSYLAKTDIADAFRLIPIQPCDHPKLGMRINGKYYYDKTLPMGASSSCSLFESFSTAIEHIFKHYAKKVTVLHYLDDFLIIAQSKTACTLYLDLLLSLCKDMGIPISEKKTCTPSICTVFLGIELDTIKCCARLPLDKLTTYLHDVRSIIGCRTITKRDLQSIIGKLSFAAAVVPGRAFLRRLIDLLVCVKKPYHYISLTRESILDLHTWIEFLSEYNGITYFRYCSIVDSNSINMCSDASKIAFGATFRSHWIQGIYPPTWQELHITILELFPIYVMISMFGEDIINSNVNFHCDNMGVVYIINKQSRFQQNDYVYCSSFSTGIDQI